MEEDQALVNGINRTIDDLNRLLKRVAKNSIDVHIQVGYFTEKLIPHTKVYYLLAEYTKELNPS